MKLFLVRHGETEWNAAGRIQGHSESDLTDRGRAEAAAAADALSIRRLAAVYTSPSSRALDTARAIADRHELAPITEPRLKEMNFGELEGLTWEEIGERYPEAQNAIRGSDPNYVIPGGENRVQLIERGMAAMNDIAERHRNETVCAVSHGGTIGWFAREVLGIPHDVGSRFRSSNCGIHVFEMHDDGWFMRTWNARSHLPPR